jgi:hypothetical protein
MVVKEEKTKKTRITKNPPSDIRYAIKKSNHFTNNITNFTTLRFDFLAANMHSRGRDNGFCETAREKDQNVGHEELRCRCPCQTPIKRGTIDMQIVQ